MYSSVWNVRGVPYFMLSCTPCHQFAPHDSSHQPTIIIINARHNQIISVAWSKRRSRITLVFFGSGRLAVSRRRGVSYRTALLGVLATVQASGLSSASRGFRLCWWYRGASSVCLGAWVRNVIGLWYGSPWYWLVMARSPAGGPAGWAGAPGGGGALASAPARHAGGTPPRGPQPAASRRTHS